MVSYMKCALSCVTKYKVSLYMIANVSWNIKLKFLNFYRNLKRVIKAEMYYYSDYLMPVCKYKTVTGEQGTMNFFVAETAEGRKVLFDGVCDTMV